MTGAPIASRFPVLASMETAGLLGREHRDVALLTGTLTGETGAMLATILGTYGLDDLLNGTDASRTTDGHDLSPETVARLLHEAEVLPTVVDRVDRVRW